MLADVPFVGSTRRLMRRVRRPERTKARPLSGRSRTQLVEPHRTALRRCERSNRLEQPRDARRRRGRAYVKNTHGSALPASVAFFGLFAPCASFAVACCLVAVRSPHAFEPHSESWSCAFVPITHLCAPSRERPHRRLRRPRCPGTLGTRSLFSRNRIRRRPPMNRFIPTAAF